MPSPPSSPPPLPSQIQPQPDPQPHFYLTSPSPSQSRSLTSLPSHYLNLYSSFVRTNSGEITRFESLLRNLVLFLPSHSSANITTEAAHTLLSLLTTFHTSILAPRRGDPGYKPSARERYVAWAKGEGASAGIRPGDGGGSNSSSEQVADNVGVNKKRSRRTIFGLSKGNLYKNALSILRLVQYLQLLLEMVAKRAGNKMRWRVVVLLESVKAVCRFVMMRVTGTRSVIGTSIGAEEQVRKIDDEDANQNKNIEVNVNAGGVGGEGWKMPRTGLTLPPLPSNSHDSGLGSNNITTYLETHMITPTDLKSARHLVRRLSTLQSQAAEIIWILRPVVYALLLQRFQSQSQSHRNGNRSGSSSTMRDWRPWIAGVAMEILSHQLAARDVKERVPGGWRGLGEVEREEGGRRSGWGEIGWWGMRGAFYDRVTGKWVKRVEEKLRGKPLLGMVGAVVEDYGWLWGEYYYSTATQ